MRPGLVYPSRVDIEMTQVAKYAALPLAVPRVPGRGKRFLEMRPSLAGPAEEDLHGAETVVSVALQRPALHFACDDQRRLELRAGRIHPTRVAVAGGEADERAALAAPVPNLASLRQRRCELRVRVRVLSGGRERATRNPMHLGGRGCSEPRGGLHHGRDLDSDPKWPAQTQPRPCTLQRIRGHIDVASRGGAATCDDEIVELGAAIGDGRLLVQARKVRAVSHF